MASLVPAGRRVSLKRRTRLTVASALIASAALTLALAASASANTIQVNTTIDEDATGIHCSLREAVASVNVGSEVGGCIRQISTGTDTITFAPALTDQTISLDLGDLDIEGHVDIVGPGMNDLDVSAASANERVFDIDSGWIVSISGLAVVNSAVTDPVEAQGGGIRNFGVLTLTDVLVDGNQAAADTSDATTTVFASGGGIYNAGGASLVLDHSAVIGNTAIANNLFDPGTGDRGTAEARGAGIFTDNGSTLEIHFSEIAANEATASDGGVGDPQASGGLRAGAEFEADHSTFADNIATATQGPTGNAQATGGILALGGGTSSLELSTVAANQEDVTAPGVPLGAGGIRNAGGGTVAIESSTIAQNGIMTPLMGAGDGGNLFNLGGTIELANTIVAEARNDALNCIGTVTSNGFNVDFSPAGPSCGLGPDELTSNPMLDSAGLALNGGPTETIGLLPGSPVIDKGSSAGQSVAGEDQRGLDRPGQFGDISNPPGGNGSDIGAVEIQIAPPTFTGTSPASPNVDDTPNVLGSAAAESSGVPTVRLFTNPSCTVLTGGPATPGVFASPGIVTGPLPHNATTTFHATVESDYGTSHCSTGAFPNTLSYTQTDPPQPVSPSPVVSAPAPMTKCTKGFVKKNGKCVKKKRKKVRK